jgi:hypothetical protein
VRLVIDEDGTEQGLLGFNVVRGRPQREGVGVRAGGFAAGNTCEELLCHARDASRFGSAQVVAAPPLAPRVPVMHTGTRIHLAEARIARLFAYEPRRLPLRACAFGRSELALGLRDVVAHPRQRIHAPRELDLEDNQILEAERAL